MQMFKMFAANNIQWVGMDYFLNEIWEHFV